MNKKETEQMKQYLREKGDPAQIVADEIEKFSKDLNAGKIKVLINCSDLTKGFKNPKRGNLYYVKKELNSYNVYRVVPGNSTKCCATFIYNPETGVKMYMAKRGANKFCKIMNTYYPVIIGI